MNPFDHMSQEFQELNRDALDEALFDQLVNAAEPTTIGDGLHSLGEGIAWAGFWLGLGLFAGAALR